MKAYEDPTHEGNGPKYTCDTCKMFACPIMMKYPKTNGCDYGPDVLDQIKKATKAKSRDFELVCKELGI
jgi:hypothetical protein